MLTATGLMINPFSSSGLFNHNSSDQCFQLQGVWFLLLLYFIENPAFNVNSVDPDQMPHSAASDLGLHCLPVTLLGCLQAKID